MSRLVLTIPLLAACGEEPRVEDSCAPPGCAPGYLLDGASCVPEACGTGSWGTLELSDATVFVDIEAAEGGDGSEQAPLRSIQAGLDLAGARGGGSVAVAAGSYPETLELHRGHSGVRLAGRCADLVVLDASVGDGDTPGIDIGVTGGEVELSGLSARGSSYQGVRLSSGRALLESMRVEESAYVGVVVLGSSLLDPSELEIEGCELLGNHVLGLLAMSDGTEVRLRDTVVRDTLPDGSGSFGFGIQVSDGAVLRVEGSELVGNSMLGVVIEDAGSEVLLQDSRVADTRPAANGTLGVGIQHFGGATLLVEGCSISGGLAAGVLAVGSGTEVVLRDSVFTGEPLEAGNGGAIQLSDGATLQAEACEIAEHQGVGVFVAEPGTAATLAGCTVRDTRPVADGRYGYGVEVHGGAGLRMLSCEVADNAAVGVFAGGAGTVVRLWDTVVRGTVLGLGENGAIAPGIFVQDGAQLWAEGSAALLNEGPGLYVATEGSELHCSDCEALENQFAGAAAVDAGTLVLEASVIQDSLANANHGGGVGVFAAEQLDYAAPSLRMVNSTVTGSSIAGVYLAGQGSYLLSDNAIQDSSGLPHGTTTRCGDGIFGAEVQAWDGTRGLLLEGNSIVDNQGAGLFLDDGRASLDGNFWQSNAPDLFVQGEACLEPMDAWAEAPTQEICPEWERPVCELAFMLDLDVEVLEPARSVGVRPLPRLAFPKLEGDNHRRR